jgi:hypothetical protein
VPVEVRFGAERCRALVKLAYVLLVVVAHVVAGGCKEFD